MASRDELARRLDELSLKANELKCRARQLLSDDDDDTLWMSSLDIIGELLNAITGLIQAEDESAGVSFISESMVCPHCHAAVPLTVESVTAPAVICPVCGDSIFLSNPT